MRYKIPGREEIKGNNGYEVPPIVILPESGESIIKIGVEIVHAVVKKYCFSPKDPFLKEKILSEEGKAKISHCLRHNGRIIIKASHLKLRIKKGQLKLNLTHWLHCHRDPNPEKALSFFGRIMRDVAREEATPEEVQEIVRRLAIEFQPEGIQFPTLFSSFSFFSSP